MVFSFFTRNKWSKLVSIILLLIFSNPIVANLGLKYLERKHPISDLTEIKKVDYIVVLSGMLKRKLLLQKINLVHTVGFLKLMFS